MTRVNSEQMTIILTRLLDNRPPGDKTNLSNEKTDWSSTK